MALFSRGDAPLFARVGEAAVLRAILDGEIVFDGTRSVLVPIPRASIAVAAPAPSVSTAHRVAIPSAAMYVDAHPPQEVSLGAAAALPTAAITVAAPAPTGFVLEQHIEIPAASISVNAPAPQVLAAGSGEVSIPTAAITVAAPAPSVSTSHLIAIPTAAIYAAAPAPSVSTGASVALPAATISVAAPAPSVSTFNGVTYTDDFNRTSLDGNWVALGTHPPIINGNKAQASTNGTNGQTTQMPARYTSVVVTDDHRSSALLVTPTGSSNLPLGVGLSVRCTSGGDRVQAIVTPTAATIYTHIGGTVTSRATQSGLSVSAGSTIALAAVGTVYTVYVDGAPVVSWTDSGGLIAIGASTRYVGFTVISARNFASAVTYGWALDDWVGEDV